MHMILEYDINLAFVALLKAEGVSLKQHPAVGALEDSYSDLFASYLLPCRAVNIPALRDREDSAFGGQAQVPGG